MRKRRGLAILIAVGILSAGCSTSVSGLAVAGSSVPSASVAGSSVPSASVAGSPSTDPSTPSASPEATDDSVPGGPTSGVPDSADSMVTPTSPEASTDGTQPPATPLPPLTLSCPAGSITASDNSFCYGIPAGFVDATTLVQPLGADPVQSAVGIAQAAGIGPRDLIFVTARSVIVDTDELSDAEIIAELTSSVTGIPGATSTTPFVPVPVAAGRGFETDIVFDDGTQKRYLLVYSGSERVAVSCQWREHQAEIATGCDKVLRSLEIAHP